MDPNTNQTQEQKSLTFGEKAAGVSFNPSKDPAVDSIKGKFAAVIDEMNAARDAATSGGAKRYFAKAISHAEDAQMNAVKAITWAHE